jgi:hypothetical protein
MVIDILLAIEVIMKTDNRVCGPIWSPQKYLLERAMVRHKWDFSYIQPYSPLPSVYKLTTIAHFLFMYEKSCKRQVAQNFH